MTLILIKSHGQAIVCPVQGRFGMYVLTRPHNPSDNHLSQSPMRLPTVWVFMLIFMPLALFIFIVPSIV